MNIDQIMQCISNLEEEYQDLIAYTINSLLQEITDPQEFYESGEKEISTDELLTNIADITSEHLSEMLMTCAIEFCITNIYPHCGEDWNCINHIITYQGDSLKAKDIKYLKALNASYMSIYKVIKVNPNESIILQDKIEKKAPQITVIDKSLSNSIKKEQYIAVRVIKKNKKQQIMQYQLTSSVLVIPEPVVKDCIGKIRNITSMMSNPMARILFGGGEVIEDTDQNSLLQKKMWQKEIMEDVYYYYTNYEEYHDIFDMDGNPWAPCILEFKVNTSVVRLRKELPLIKDIIPDFVSGNKDQWIWFDKEVDDENKKDLFSNVSNITSKRSPVLSGELITDNYDNRTYSIFATIRLTKNKLIVDINSRQRANIMQMQLTECLGDLVSDPIIYLADKNQGSI